VEDLVGKSYRKGHFAEGMACRDVERSYGGGLTRVILNMISKDSPVLPFGLVTSSRTAVPRHLCLKPTGTLLSETTVSLKLHAHFIHTIMFPIY
jgi:hypothetical protein